MSKTRLKALSPLERGGLVAILWLILLIIVIVGSNNLPRLAEHLPRIGVACLGFCGAIIAFSLLAAAIRVTLDVVRGKYPY